MNTNKKELHTNPCIDCPIKDQTPECCKVCAYQPDKKEKSNICIIFIQL